MRPSQALRKATLRIRSMRESMSFRFGLFLGQYKVLQNWLKGSKSV